MEFYNDDPEKNIEATKFENLSFDEVLKKELKVMDTTAFTLSQENKLPIIVFDINTPDNLYKVVKGRKYWHKSKLINFIKWKN